MFVFTYDCKYGLAGFHRVAFRGKGMGRARLAEVRGVYHMLLRWEESCRCKCWFPCQKNFSTNSHQFTNSWRCHYDKSCSEQWHSSNLCWFDCNRLHCSKFWLHLNLALRYLDLFLGVATNFSLKLSREPPQIKKFGERVGALLWSWRVLESFRFLLQPVNVPLGFRGAWWERMKEWGMGFIFHNSRTRNGEQPELQISQSTSGSHQRLTVDNPGDWSDSAFLKN